MRGSVLVLALLVGCATARPRPESDGGGGAGVYSARSLARKTLLGGLDKGGLQGGGAAGGGDSLWEANGSGKIKPSGSVHSTTLTENDANSRDTPKAVQIVCNDGLPNNPCFAIGNPYIAGVGLEAMGIWYTDDTMAGDVYPWKLCFSWERSGTLASVLDGVARSAWESFGDHGGYKPWTRIEKSTQGINFGASARASPGAVSRSANVITVNTDEPHRMSVGDCLWKTTATKDGAVGDLTKFGADSDGSCDTTITAVPDDDTFRYASVGSNATSTGGILYTKETDVTWGRDGTGIAAVRANGSTVGQFTPAGLILPDLSVLGVTIVNFGAAGVASADATAAQFHVKEGKTFYQEGLYKSTGWYNGGGETQSSEVFVVGTGSGNKSTSLPVISGRDWLRFMVTNHGEGAAHTLQINAGSGNTINGAASLIIPANAGATLVSVGTDWRVFYHPPPP